MTTTSPLPYLLKTLREDIAEVEKELVANAEALDRLALDSFERTLAREERERLHGRNLAYHGLVGRVEAMISIEEIYADAPERSPYRNELVA